MLKRETIISFGSLAAFTIIFSFTLSNYLYQGAQLNLWSFSMVHMAGYFFFLVMPVELLVPFILKAGYSSLLIWGLSLLTAMIPLVFDYAVGYIVPAEHVMDFIGKRRYERLTKKLDVYGKYIVFFVGLTPLSEPILALVSGIVKFSFRDTMLYSLLGMAIKYAVVIWLAHVGISLWW